MIKGTKDRPRLSLYRSSKHIYGQLIDDAKGVTLVSASDFELKSREAKKLDLAKEVGELLAKKAKAKKISKAVFDRGDRQYHGAVKNFAEGARIGGLKF